jgi:6-phosphogluconolactonase
VLNRSTGALTERGTPANVGDSPTFIAPSADHRFAYLAMESYSNKAGVASIALSDTGVPSLLQLQPESDGMVFTSIDPSGKYVLSASYGGGFVKVYPVQPDGTLAPAVDTEQFDKPADADSAQTHSVRVHPNGKWAYVPNKGLDAIAQFNFDASSGKLTAMSDKLVPCTDGPRHVAFNKDGSLVFIATENSYELVVYRPDANGSLKGKEADRKVSLPSAVSGNTGAHVLVHPNDKFVYMSNRGDDSIAVFAVTTDGKLTLLQNAKTLGRQPRNFDLDSSGKFLIAANQDDSGKGKGSLIVFAIGADGKLTQQGQPVTGLDQPAAVSVVTSARP